MKKILVVLSMLVLGFGLTACGKTDNAAPADEPTTEAAPAAEAAPAEAAPAEAAPAEAAPEAPAAQ